MRCIYCGTYRPCGKGHLPGGVWQFMHFRKPHGPVCSTECALLAAREWLITLGVPAYHLPPLPGKSPAPRELA